MRRIIFMHISKTAGISVCDAFIQQLGSEYCIPFVDHRAISEASFQGRTFVSGHVYLGDICADAFKFTFLREPIAQIASHLLWIEHLGEPERAEDVYNLPMSVQQAIAAIKRTDLSSAVSIDAFLSNIPLGSDQRIVNVQSEMLAFSRGKVEKLSSKELSLVAITNLKLLDFVGITEYLKQDIELLFSRLDLGKPAGEINILNRSPSRQRIDIRETSIKRVLAKWSAPFEVVLPEVWHFAMRRIDRCRRRDISRKRSSRSYARSMCWSHRVSPLPRPSVQSR